MYAYIPFLAFAPFLGLILIALFQSKQEKAIYSVAIASVVLHAVGLISLSAAWVAGSFAPMFVHGPVLYQTHDSHFSIDFFFDGIGAVYGLVAAVLTIIVLIFSRYYMHRDPGFKRFFGNVLFFYTGLHILLFSGNLETLFIGWEIIGVTSFFLIAYYRDRYLPVKNALKVVSLYRVADVALLLGIWLCHHAFEQNINFQSMYNGSLIVPAYTEHAVYSILVPALFLLAGMVKSAQFPFSTWLPRAMEGPTTSSAIFYGSLSVHIGVFFMMRTYPLWVDHELFRMLVLLIGIATSLIATSIARVQSTVKTRIAYASIAQIGLMFAEVALGWHSLALLHFAANAFLRSYQLLVSPSVLSYEIHDQFFHFHPQRNHVADNWLGRLKAGIYVLSIKEWNLDTFMFRRLWQPLKQAGRWLGFLSMKWIWFVVLPVLVTGLYFVYNRSAIPGSIQHYLPAFMSLAGTLMALKAFTERGDAAVAWTLVTMNQLFSAISIGLNAEIDYQQIHLFFSGIAISSIGGFWIFREMRMLGLSLQLDRLQGHAFNHPVLTFWLMLACLGLSGFPITPAFIGEDLLLGNIDDHQYLLLSLTALGLILDGLAVFRVYGRLCLGPNPNGYHEVAYRSS